MPGIGHLQDIFICSARDEPGSVHCGKAIEMHIKEIPHIPPQRHLQRTLAIFKPHLSR